MEKKHRQHLKTRKSNPFNLLSKGQEDAARVASIAVWEIILKKYPKLNKINDSRKSHTRYDDVKSLI